VGSLARAESSDDSKPITDPGSLRDRYGRKRSSGEWGKDRLTAIAIVDPTAAPSDDLFKEMNLLEQKYRQQKINLVAIYEDVQTDTLAMSQHAMDANLSWLALRDLDGEFTTALGVQTIPYFLLVDKDKRVIYRGGLGSIDLKQPGLTTAIEEGLAGKPISQANLDYPGRERSEPVEDQIRYRTFTDHIAPIIASRCRSCHSMGGIAPFPLVSFQDAVVRADAIREVIVAGKMPPAQHDPRYGVFKNIHAMTKQEAKNIIDWIDSGRNVGNASARAQEVERVDWHIDRPQLIIVPKEGVAIPAAKGLRAYYVLADEAMTNQAFAQDTFVNQLECRPSQPNVVKHLQAYIIPPEITPLPENRTKAIATVTRTPSGRDFSFPDGTSLKIPARSRVLFEMLVGTTARETTEKPSLGLVLASGSIDSEILMERLGADEISIEPNDGASVRQEDRRLVSSIELWGILPAMNLLGKEFRLTVQEGRDEPETLLQLTRYEPSHRMTYWLEEQRTIRAGSRLAVEGRWDHSRFVGRPLPSKDPVVAGPFPRGETLDCWLIYRLAKGTAAPSPVLTDTREDTLSASIRVHPSDPLSVPTSLAEKVELSPPADAATGTWEIVCKEPTPKDPRSAQVTSAIFKIEPEHLYVARFTISSDEQQKLGVALSTPAKPGNLDSDPRFVEIGKEPKVVAAALLAHREQKEAAVHLLLGECKFPVRLMGIEVEDFGKPKEIPLLARNSSKTGTLVRFVEDSDEAIRVEVPPDVGPQIWNDSLVTPGQEVKEGTEYVITFRARADRVRKLHVALTQDHPPGLSIGVQRDVILVRSWERYVISGTATKTDTAGIAFFLGADDTDFEMADIEWKAR
jgi:hypothetical protein